MMILFKVGMRAKKNLSYLMLISAILLVGVIYSSPFAYADDDDDDDDDDHDDIICANTILGGNIDDNVRVPFGSWCQLERAIVSGSVILEEESSVDIFESTINKNIKGPETAEVYLSLPSVVKGNVDVDGVVLIEGVDGNTLTVDKHVKSKGSGVIRIWEALIDGKVDVKQKNVVDIFGSTIDGDLKVKETIGGSFFSFSVNLEENNISKKVEVKEVFTKDVIITGNIIEGNLDVKDHDDDDDDDNGNVNVEKSLNKIFLIISNIIGGHLDVKDNIGKSITVESNAVSKDLDVKDNTSEDITLKSNVVEKKFDVKDNTGKTVVDLNEVGKDMKVEKNEDVSVTNNDIEKDLEIKKNTICTESGNDVEGKRKIKNC